MLADLLIPWFAEAGRTLPWRGPGVTPYAVLVSEVMLQQTPVARVEPAYLAWLERWPTVADLAAAEPGDAVRMWGRLGYPRRALRLHAAAVVCLEQHAGELPTTVAALLALPGVGDYTARAVAVFALGQRHPVVDTNVRRVVARAIEGRADALVKKSDLALVEALLPAQEERAGQVSIAVMELGALICTARAPQCGQCPLHERCAWLAAGRPALAEPIKKTQTYAGTDRQVRGRLLAVLRGSELAVTQAALAAVWPEPVQRDRALASLLRDGLVVALGEQTFGLPMSIDVEMRTAAAAQQ